MSVINREAAIEAIERNAYRHTYLDQIINIISNLPSAEVTLCHLDSPCEYQNADIAMPTAEKVGKWERKWHTFFKRELPCCSACGKFEAFERNYCPYCGARLIGEENA